MNAEKYKTICNLPDVLPRSLLEETKNILIQGNIPEVNIVKKALLDGKIEFPESYDGNPSMSFHKVNCSILNG